MSGICRRLLLFSPIIFSISARIYGQQPVVGRASVVLPRASVVVPTPSSFPPWSLGAAEFPPVLDPIAAPAPYPIFRSRGTFGLFNMVRGAGIIFSGYVMSVAPGVSPSGANAAFTTVSFRVEHSLRGTSPGSNLTIHEWAGLWSRGERYRVGERVMLFLYPASRLGLTSPVAGAEGRFGVDGQDRILLNAGNSAGLAGDVLVKGRTLLPYGEFAKAVRQTGGLE